MNNENFWEMGDYKDARLSKINLPGPTCDKILQWVKAPQNFLVFLGSPGVGKTYMIAAIIHRLLELGESDLFFRYMNERSFYSKMRKTIDLGWDYEEEIKTLCSTKWFFMDDIRSTQGTEFQKECLLSFVDQRSLMQFPTVITSNCLMNDLSQEYHPRFISRLKDKRNTIIELNWVDKRQNDA